MKKKNLVPKRRFKDFQNIDTLEYRKLGEISDIKTGPFGSALHAKDYVEAGIPIITTEHFKQGNLPETKKGTPQVSDIDYLRLKSYKLQEGDLVFSRVGSVDINALVTNHQEGWLFSGRVLRVRPQKGIHSAYLHYLLDTKTVRNDVLTRAVGQTMPSINTEILKNTNIIMSNHLEEQRKLAAILQKLDGSIVFQQRKLEKTKALKAAYLAEMFPAEGEQVPKRRFAGFSGVWKLTKLEELAEVRTGKAFSSLDFNGDGEYLVITNKNVQNQENDIPLIGDRIDFKNKSIINDYLLNGINVLVTMDGVNIGKTGKIKHEKAVLAQRVGRLNSDQIEFVYQITKKNEFILEMNKVSVGNAIKHISLKQIAEYSFLAPTLKEEQKAIGEFFKKIDDSIRNQQKKLDKLKAMKQAYLEEMFV